MGGKEAQDGTVSSVQDLAKAFSTYNEEVLAKREELLQYAQDAIAGLKVNAEIVRIDSEVSGIHKKLNVMKNKLPLLDGSNKSSETTSGMFTENLGEALEHVRLCSRLEELLLRKKFLKGDSPTAHNQKVDKLKILSESLASSTSKAEKRISENRVQKEEALRFRVTKTSEVSQLEKELAAEIKDLQKRKDDLEEELKKVNVALTSAHARLHNAREERDQFDEASNQIIQHFKSKDDELSKSIASYRAEALVCNTFVNFLESTWNFQSSCAKKKEKLVNDELERHEDYLVNLAKSLLGALKNGLGPSVSSLRELVENLKRLDGISTEEDEDSVNSRKTLEEQYQNTLIKLTTAFDIIENIKKQSSTEKVEDSRKRDQKMTELLDELDKIKSEFESIETPILEFEAPPTLYQDTPPKDRIPFMLPRETPKEKLYLDHESTSENYASQKGTFRPFIRLPLVRSQTTKVQGTRHMEHLEPLLLSGKKSSDAEVQLTKLKLELELEDYSRGNSTEDGIIDDWEFDEKFEEPRRSV